MPKEAGNSKLSRWFGRLLAWSFGGVFLWAGALKLNDPAAFVMDVRSFRILPDPFSAWLALGLPWLEVLAGLAVVTGLLRRGGLLLLNISLLVFAGALVSAWVRGIDVDCGCFGGKDGATSIREALVRDAVLLLAGLALAWKERSSHGVHRVK